MRHASPWLATLAVLVMAACGGAGQAAPTSQAVVSPATAATAPAQGPTSTPEPLTESELKDEDDFLATAVSFTELPASAVHFPRVVFTKTLTRGPFQVDIARAGRFTLTDPDSEDTRYFRLELRITNVGSENEVFAPDAIALSDDEGNRYELQPGASNRTLSLPIEIGPETTERGYLLFQPISKQLSRVRLAFELGGDEDGTPHEFEFELEI